MEVEIKFKLTNDVERRVEEIAKPVREVFQEDLYFNSPVVDFKKSDEALRIRRSHDVRITYKGPKIDSDTKTREEIEIVVDDYEKAVKILEKLGFKPIAFVKKHRRIYEIEDIKICIDKVEGLGKFLEIEIECDNVEIGKEKLFKIAKALGLKTDESIRESYLELLLKKN
jgi:adenylate cyclase class 2